MLPPGAFRRKGRSTEPVADPALRAFLRIRSGRDEAWRRYSLCTLLVGLPLLRDVIVPRHEALAQLSYTSPQPGEPSVRDPEKRSRIVRRASD
jgi:hypothetical protein